MPLYEYQCPSCGEVFEMRRPMSQASEPAPCPKCGTQAQRVPSAFGCKVGSYIRPATGALRGSRPAGS